MLSCKDITEKASAYLDKDLSWSQRLAVRLHLVMCLHCRRYLYQLRTTIQTLGLMKAEQPIDEAYTRDLIQHFRNHTGQDKKHSTE